jgi:hypothetical protein
VSSHFYVKERSFHRAERYITIDVVQVFIDLTALVPNERVLLSVADCQAKTDESAVIIILGCTAETRQPQAIEVTQSYSQCNS